MSSKRLERPSGQRSAPSLLRRRILHPIHSRNRTGNELILQLGRIATELGRVLHPGEHAGVLPQEAQLRQVLEEALAAIRRVG